MTTEIEVPRNWIVFLYKQPDHKLVIDIECGPMIVDAHGNGPIIPPPEPTEADMLDTAILPQIFSR